MSDKIKVMVVDDSAFMRKVISDIINKEFDMEVVCTARDGEDAILKVTKNEIDVITMDVEMPNKNGLEALKEIKKISSCEVIMISSLTSSESEITVESLKEGAFDFIKKPSGSISMDMEKIKKEIVEKVRYAGVNKNKKGKYIKKESVKALTSIPTKISENTKKKINIVLLGASTGGPKVLYDLITSLPGDLNVPVVVVQHMPPEFTKAFAERINKNSKLKVKEAENGEKICDNVVYIAPGGYHTTIDANTIKLDTTPQIHGVRPAVDKLFISAADYYKGSILACIFTGMGRDGAEGVKKIKSLDGYIISQDEMTSVIYGMPKAAFETGCVDMVLPDYKFSSEIVRIVRGL